MRKLVLTLCLLGAILAHAQEIKRKTLTATRVSTAPKIDGNLNDAVWKNIPVAKNFVMFDPGDGDTEPNAQKTEVKVVYDDEAIYFAAYLYDSHPETIMRQFSDRDNFAQADFFGVIINPLNDNQNDTEFFVSAAGTQSDAKVSTATGEDFSWSDVWYSKISFDDKGWYIEMKIPFAALRFSNEKVQTWGLNFKRLIQSRRERYSWNYIDKSVGRASQYSGLLTNLKNIKTSIRLNFLPIFTSNILNFEGTTITREQIGLNIKYGLSDNFTLDATINPDFSQAGFDDLVLNLGPFETRFAEQRQFFIEGADLLNKGGLFFSRRIGKRPINFYDAFNNLSSSEEIISNPSEAKLISAAKISGRSKKGLGIAVLNAVTDKTEAIIKDNITGAIRKVTTEPLANYNVLVLDQEFNKNSSVSFINTHISRNNNFRRANASALLFNLANKANSKKLSGSAKFSSIKDPVNGNTKGFSSNLSYSKTKGKFRYGLSNSLADDKYDINDLGFQRRNNFNAFFGNMSYRIFKPTKHFNSYSINLRAGMFRRYKPNVYTGNFVNLNFFATTLKQFSFGGNINGSFGTGKDYNEPRNDVDFIVTTARLGFFGFVSSDFRKKFAYNASISYNRRYGEKDNGYSFGFTPIYRANDKFFLSYSFNYDITFDERGYITTLDNGDIIFGFRNIKSVLNSLSGKYSFSDLSSLTIAFRYNWTPVTYKNNYAKLDEKGLLVTSAYSGNNDVNFNSWNLDLRYVWQFARGSELSVLYRNAIFNSDDQSNLSFSDNLSNLFKQPLQQNLSIRFVYYLDYNKIKSWL
ncbi:MAG: carbohydrate binding family 9 domain-containing protein [Flavobacteriaceae bacterium]|nr:carbohydrate binding family 9 domain-containing protein [Flavobacteriaceae bacterium]